VGVEVEESVGAITAPEPAVVSDDEVEMDAEPAVIEVPPPRPRASIGSDPLEPFMALSAEEKIALFT
jgi:hypothetical protein